MVTPFEVYVVMQLDTVIVSAFVFGMLLFIVGAFYVAVGSEDYSRGMFWAGVVSFALGILCILAGTFLPSTKTAAAMIVLPAITSEEVVAPVSAEARELYDLAKQAIRKAVDAEAPAKAEVEK